jgi:copper chaperone
MTCEHCVNSVRGEVSQIPGVTEADLDLASGRLEVVSDTPVTDADVRAAVQEAGYELAS